MLLSEKKRMSYKKLIDVLFDAHDVNYNDDLKEAIENYIDYPDTDTWSKLSSFYIKKGETVWQIINLYVEGFPKRGRSYESVVSSSGFKFPKIVKDWERIPSHDELITSLRNYLATI